MSEFIKKLDGTKLLEHMAVYRFLREADDAGTILTSAELDVTITRVCRLVGRQDMLSNELAERLPEKNCELVRIVYGDQELRSKLLQDFEDQERHMMLKALVKTLWQFIEANR